MLFNNRLVAQEDSVKPENVVKLHYFNTDDNMQYLILESMVKNGRILTPHKDMTYAIYLDSADQKNLISNVKTDEEGKAKAFIPPALKNAWEASPKHTFIVKAGDVEMRVGIKRMVGILSAGDEATYTTDSTVSVTVELKKDSMPGDLKGNIVLAVKVDDNDELGNLREEKSVPWGIATKVNNTFFEERTLWTTRFRTPYWLLLTVYSITIGIWGTLIYLVFRLIKIGKLGKQFAIESGLDDLDKK